MSELNNSNAGKSELVAAEELLSRAIGGWRGVIDSGLPTVVFLVVWTVSKSDLKFASASALLVAGILAILRAIQRKSLQQVLSGLFGVAIAAYVSTKTGKAEDFFLPGILTNLGYAAGISVSILFRVPLVGFLIGGLTGSFTAWRNDPAKLRKYSLISWWWVGLFTLRLAVQVPLYLGKQLELLGTAKLIMGWPLYLATAYVTYRAVVNAKPSE